MQLQQAQRALLEVQAAALQFQMPNSAASLNQPTNIPPPNPMLVCGSSDSGPPIPLLSQMAAAAGGSSNISNIPSSNPNPSIINDASCHASSNSCQPRGPPTPPNHLLNSQPTPTLLPPPPPSSRLSLPSYFAQYNQPSISSASIQSGPHHVAAEVLLDPSGTFQSEVIIHSTPDAAHQHMHHHHHQHHYSHPTYPARLHFGVSPPGVHISISPSFV